jgi:hypothetical protein
LHDSRREAAAIHDNDNDSGEKHAANARRARAAPASTHEKIVNRRNQERIDHHQKRDNQEEVRVDGPDAH